MPITKSFRSAAASLALVCFALAPSALAKTVKTELEIYRDGLVHDVLVEKGTYNVVIASSLDKVTFYKNGKEIVSAPCEVKALPEGTMGNAVYYDPTNDGHESITKIRLVNHHMLIDLKG